MEEILLKRVYEPKGPEDGFRILVDRLWPRGLKKEDAGIDLWLKDIGPSTDLRKWFDHDPAKWDEFRADYRFELKRNTAAVKTLQDCIRKHGKVSLLFGARDETYNQAVVIKAFLEQQDQAWLPGEKRPADGPAGR